MNETIKALVIWATAVTVCLAGLVVAEISMLTTIRKHTTQIKAFGRAGMLTTQGALITADKVDELERKCCSDAPALR